ncbi:MAG: hypothetical protein ABL986_19105 [Vicinamibacterales bacterium]
MRVAWFRAASTTSVDASALQALLAGLRAAHHIDLVTEPQAHGFVVEHALRPYDLCVYEPRNDPHSAFIWGYLFNYPGILLLRERTLHDVRVHALERYRRDTDYNAEFRFNHGHPPPETPSGFARGRWPMLRAALQASRIVVVGTASRRTALEASWPHLTVRTVAPFAAGPDQPSAAAPFPDTEVVLALQPPGEEPDLTPALSAMAAGKAVIVFEGEATADWPAFDPQTWRTRDVLAQMTPVVVSIDPRDEQHSLTLALRGLASDGPRRHALGTAAREWWTRHATPARAVSDWMRLLEEAAATPLPSLPPDWPPHLHVDGAEHLRRVTREMGLTGSVPGLESQTPVQDVGARSQS